MSEKYVIDVKEIARIYDMCRERYNEISRIINGYHRGIVNVDWSTFNLLQQERSVLVQYMMVLNSMASK